LQVVFIIVIHDPLLGRVRERYRVLVKVEHLLGNQVNVDASTLAVGTHINGAFFVLGN